MSDRSVYDVLAYGVFYRVDGKPWYRAVERELGGQRRYDAVVYVPVQFLPADDGFRFVCPGCQLCVDLALREILRTVGSGERVITVGAVDPEARLQEVLQALRLLELVPAGGHVLAAGV